MAEFLRSIQDSDGPAAAAEPEVRLAVYDSPLAAPRVVSLRGSEFHEFVGDLAARTYNFGRERGGRIPYIVIAGRASGGVATRVRIPRVRGRPCGTDIQLRARARRPHPVHRHPGDHREPDPCILPGRRDQHLGRRKHDPHL